MGTINPLKDLDRVVLISEKVDKLGHINPYDKSLERISFDTTKLLEDTILGLGIKVSVYDNPQKFQQNINKHLGDLVLAPWNGSESPNRLAIVPAICEAAGVAYVGADANTRIICNDKELAKVIARRAGFICPVAVRLLSGDSFKLVDGMKYPLIVKPCLEGTSIGISEDSVCRTSAEVKSQSKKLWERGFNDILVEEFIVGREVSICILGNKRQIEYTGVVEIYLEDMPDYLLTRPYDAKIKKGQFGIRKVRSMPSVSFASDIGRASKVFRMLTKIQMLRLDGRLTNDGKFVLIEFATFPTIGLASEFSCCIAELAGSYQNFIAKLLAHAQEDA